jgi:hypothetical protein
MMKPGRLLGLLALAAAALPAPVPAAQQEQERLGRLFFTPAQRSSLDVARGQRARTTLATETDQDAAPASQTITYGGLIRRDDGRTTVWLNNQPVHDTDPAGAGAVVTRVRPDGRITLQAPQSSRSVDLKPGQSVELLSGTIEEGYSRRALSEPAPKPKPGAKPAADAKKGKPLPSDVARAAEQEREERQQQIIEDAVSRAISETAAARPGAPPVPAAPSGGPVR